MKAALLLGNYRPTYVLARSLKLRGYVVTCGLDGFDRGAEMSRYVDSVWQHSRLQDGAEKLQQELSDLLAARPAITTVFPITEPIIRAFAEGRLRLPLTVKLGSVTSDLVIRCLDKQRLLSEAQAISIPVSPFKETSGKDDFYSSAEEIGFPLVLRPLQSGKLLDGAKAKTVEHLPDLYELDHIWRKLNYKLLV